MKNCNRCNTNCKGDHREVCQGWTGMVGGWKFFDLVVGTSWEEVLVLFERYDIMIQRYV